MRRPEQGKAGDEKPRPQDIITLGFAADVAEIQTRVAARPVVDDRSQDEIIGYDEFGLPS